MQLCMVCECSSPFTLLSPKTSTENFHEEMMAWHFWVEAGVQTHKIPAEVFLSNSTIRFEQPASAARKGLLVGEGWYLKRLWKSSAGFFKKTGSGGGGFHSLKVLGDLIWSPFYPFVFKKSVPWKSSRLLKFRSPQWNWMIQIPGPTKP